MTQMQIVSNDHFLKQPPGKQYGVWCWEALGGRMDIECESFATGGHLGDFEDYASASQLAERHPHETLIRFYTSFNEKDHPSSDFEEAYSIARKEDRARW